MRLSLVLCGLLLLLQDPAPRPGYTDTPLLPGQPWHVHDPQRPYPPVVKAGAKLGDAPSDAIVLFDGASLAAWSTPDGKIPGWKVENGAMVVAGNASLQSKASFGDCQLHLEWATPKTRDGDSQSMGNSGVYLMGLYEIQVLDTWNNPSYADGTAAALYGQYPPDVNVCRPSGVWQSYDIFFRHARFDAQGKRTMPARITVLHNGVLVHLDRAILGPTKHRILPPEDPQAAALPLLLQNHGDPVRYRNIWIRKLEE